MKICPDCARAARYTAGPLHGSKCLRHRPHGQNDSAATRAETAWMRNLLMRLASDLDELAIDAEPLLQNELSCRAAMIRRNVDDGPPAVVKLPRVY